ncbi:hypothetical protein PUR61_25680, partial [Streptomyces sp. BE20]|nr:hypothetical protein [Streptomyces sp. BE20]
MRAARAAAPGRAPPPPPPRAPHAARPLVPGLGRPPLVVEERPRLRVADLTSVQPQPDGRYELLVTGTTRFRLRSADT